MKFLWGKLAKENVSFYSKKLTRLELEKLTILIIHSAWQSWLID
jgi:hypothetical protein